MRSDRVLQATTIFVMVVPGWTAPSYGAVERVWAVNGSEKVYRYQSDHPDRLRNSIWDGQTIRLKGLFNEVLDLQVIVEADRDGAEGLEVVVGPLLHSQDGRSLGSAAGNAYGPQGGVEVFSQHYIEVERPTPSAWFYGSERSAPPRGTGWIPDPLIPPNAREGRGGFPLDIPPSRQRSVTRDHELVVLGPEETQNQGFWIDLYMPRDRSMPAGLYRGAVQVLEKGAELAVLPLEVTLLPHYLPDENHSNVWLYTSAVRRYFPDLGTDEVDRLVKFLAHRHRVDAVGGFDAHRSPFSEEMMESYKPFLDGSAFTPSGGYSGPGEGVGEKLFPVGMYGRPVLGNTRESVRKESDKWVSWFQQNAPDVQYFWYVVDEPGPSFYPWLRERGKWIDENPGVGSRMPVFVTRGYTEQLSDVIDFWCGHNGVDLEHLGEFRGPGKGYCFYNGHRPRYGSVLLEGEAVDFRVNAWAKYIHRVDTWFVWEGTHWTHNHSGPKGNLHQRVFSQPVTFLSWSGTAANGDGVVFYPGRMPFYPDEDRGLNELLGSIRLKNIRRGQQDFEIMWLAEQKVGREKVLEIIRRVVPRSLEADLEGPVHWSQRGDDYERVRVQLIELLED